MKQVICSILSLFFVQIGMAQSQSVEELATGLEAMIKNNADQLETHDRRQIRRNLRQIRLIFADYGIFPGNSSGSEFTRVYSCSDQSDPALYRTIFDSQGQEVRFDKLGVYTQGGDDQEKRACEAELSQSELGESMRGTCRCESHGGDTQLYFELVDQGFETVAGVKINTFTVGGDDEERNDCLAMAQSLAICTGL